LRPTAGTGERQGYANALAGLWTGLARTLARLDEIAAHALDGDGADELPRLQYALHAASERVYGIEPPAGAESAHAELAAALAGARDATAEVLEALESGGTAAAAAHVLEWRGALFRVRLARLRLGNPAPAPRTAADAVEPAPPLSRLAAALVLGGLAAFAGGAISGVWPVWIAGLVLVAIGFGVHR
jgi:hypothetical protein